MYSVTLPTLLLQIINATQVVDKCICVKKKKNVCEVFSTLMCDSCIANCVFSLVICIIIVIHLVEI